MIAAKGVNAKMPVLDSLHCYRSLWVDLDTDQCGQTNGPKLEEANKRRRCTGFRRYRAGFSPDELKQIALTSEERRIQFVYTIAAVLIGCVLTLLGQLAGKYMGLTK